LLSILEKDKDQPNLFLVYNREVKPPKGLTQSDESDIATPKAKSPTKGKVRTKSEYQSGDIKLFQNRITSKRQRRGTLGIKDEEGSSNDKRIKVCILYIYKSISTNN
jgi:hypothetical protein